MTLDILTATEGTDAAALLAADRAHLWHPYTSMTDPTLTRLVTGAGGVRLELAGGQRKIDGSVAGGPPSTATGTRRSTPPRQRSSASSCT